MDAIHYKVKENHQYITKAAYVVLGMGVWIGENESSKFWLQVMSNLKNCGINVQRQSNGVSVFPPNV